MAVRKDAPDDRKRRTAAAPSYSAKDIQVLEGLEAVRRRPGMYIGTTDLRGLHHLVREVLDNSIDEAMNGTCDRIDLWIHKTNEITVADNGRGIPAGPHPTQKDAKGKPMDALQVVMTILHAGGKFGGTGYKVTGGLHGVGVSVVNALSEWLRLTIKRDGTTSYLEFKDGAAVAELKEIGKTEKRGTEVHFLASKQTFNNIEYH
jgi:DNA gyrase subunit B